MFSVFSFLLLPGASRRSKLPSSWKWKARSSSSCDTPFCSIHLARVELSVATDPPLAMVVFAGGAPSPKKTIAALTVRCLSSEVRGFSSFIIAVSAAVLSVLLTAVPASAGVSLLDV